MTSMCDPDSQPWSSDSLRRSPSAFQQAICRRLRVFRFARYRRFFALLVRPRELPTAAPPAPPPLALVTGGAVSLIQCWPGRCGRTPDGLSSRGSGPLNGWRCEWMADGAVRRRWCVDDQTTAWWHVGHRRPAPRGRTGIRFVPPAALHDRGMTATTLGRRIPPVGRLDGLDWCSECIRRKDV